MFFSKFGILNNESKRGLKSSYYTNELDDTTRGIIPLDEENNRDRSLLQHTKDRVMLTFPIDLEFKLLTFQAQNWHARLAFAAHG
jgi:hypothetical protein